MKTTATLSPRQTLLRDGHRVWAEIDLDRLAANVRGLKQKAGEAHLLAVVKASAYGHGALGVARTILDAGAWGLGVISVDEGEELRRGGIHAPILVLGSISPRVASGALASDLRVTVGSSAVADALAEAARAAGRRAIVHLKVETGLNRYGLLPADVLALAAKLREMPEIVVEGLATHLASVDEGDKSFTYQQFELFRACAEQLPWVPLHHISSTGAILDLPDLRLAMVRTGIGVYGYYPSDEVSRSVALQPALSLRTRIARVAEVGESESVGYGRAWLAQRPSRIATVMAGYGDGVRRNLSSRGTALVRGHRVPYVGRIAMDMLMLDVTDVADVEVEDEVTLIGEQGSEQITADEMAREAGTISYEILAGIMSRVPRFYIRDAGIVASHELSGYRELNS